MVVGSSEKVDLERDVTTVPHKIEAFIVKSKDPCVKAKVTTIFNDTVTYEESPFRFNGAYVKFGKKLYSSQSLEGLLSEAGFMQAEGVELVVNVHTPVPEFTDKAKTHLNADNYKDDLLKAVHHVTKGTIKEVERAARERRRQNRAYSLGHRVREPSKKC